MAEKGKKGSSKNEVSLTEMAALEEELKEVKKEAGIDEGPGKHNIVARYFDHNDNRVKMLLSKKKYILLLIFTGWFGGHRFYAHMWISAVLYLALCWTGLPIAFSVIDLLAVIPMKADENGKILL